MNEIRKHSRAGLSGLAAGFLLISPASATAGLSDDSIEPLPQVTSYEDIDRALEGTWLVPPGALWRYFPGTAQPCEGDEWADEGFDDSSWSEGPSPFLYGVDGEGTVIEEMGEGVTSVYLRGALEVPEPGRYERILLELPVDDGFVFYFNGTGTKRRGAGEPLEIPGAAFTASTERSTTTRPVPSADLTRTIEDGFNQLAVHAFVHADDSRSFAVHPTVRAWYRRSPGLDRERLATLTSLIESIAGEAQATRLAYLEARHAQRGGDLETAADLYARLSELDPASPLVWSRRVECQRGLGTLPALEAECRERFASEPSVAMLDTWARLCLEELGHGPFYVATAIPADLELPAGSYLDDTRWLARELEAAAGVRIDCGQAREREVDGVRWSRDRFFAPGTLARTTLSDGTTPRSWGEARTVRVAARSLDDLTPMYRIPLPEGPYELRLTFVGNDGEACAAGEALLDVVLEDAVLMRGYDPVVEAGRRGVDQHSFPVWIEDGFLDLDLRQGGELEPWLAGIEVMRTDVRSYSEHAAAWVSAPEEPCVFARVQLARALVLGGELHAALALLEQAEAQPDFLPRHARLLSSVRTELLPQLLSFASAEDLARNHADLCEARLPEIQAAAGEGVMLATYLAGCLRQNAGQVEEALGAFEELVISGTTEPGPYVRMAQCLVAADLSDHAIDILDQGLSAGAKPTPAWLQLWISLNLRTLGREPWAVVADLESLGAPEQLVVVPTSQHVPQPWYVSAAEPPSTAWSRTTFDASPWPLADGVLGSGQARGASTRGLWNTDSVYAQRTFQLPYPGLLYPHLSVLSHGAVNTYVNGTALGFVGIDSGGYIPMPARKATWLEGDNVIGMHAFNQTGASAADVGVVQPLGDLMWVARQLEENGAVRLNCGGPEVTTSDGTVWGEDRFFGWGPAVSVSQDDPWQEIASTEHDVLYHSMRAYHSDVISTWYQIPLPDGRYRVRLHFAEIEEGKGEGDRTFIVSLEKKAVFRAHDIVACVGYATADVHEVEVDVSDGWLDLRIADLDHFSVISALEIEPIPE